MGRPAYSAAVAAVAALACGCPTPTPDVALLVRFETLVDGAPLAAGGAIEIPGDILVDTALLWVADLRVVADVGEVEDTGAFALDLENASATERAIAGAPPGLYSRFRAEARPVNPDVAMGFPPGLVEGEDGYSIRISGTAEGVPFDYLEEEALPIDVRKLAGLDVAGGACATFRVRIDVARWLETVDLAAGQTEEGVVRIGGKRNPGLRDSLRAAFAAEGVVTVEGSAGGC